MLVKIAIIVVLLLAAMVLVLFEILTVTFGFFTLLAIIALGSAIWLAATVSPLFAVFLAIAAVALLPPYIIVLVRLLPKLPVGRKLFLADVPNPMAAGLPETSKYQQLVGQTGVAETLMRPAGAIRIAGERVPAMAESGVIEKGAAVKVVAAGDQNIVVRRIDGPAPGGQG